MNSIGRLRLHSLLGDGMVLQRNSNVRVWGWVESGRRVTVRFLGCCYQALADAGGRWSVSLKKSEAGGPYEMEIESDGRKIALRNILIGDVWICSGQSNMQLPMERVKDRYAEIVAHADYPSIRQFDVPEHYDFRDPCENTEGGKWESVSRETILRFTAVGFFFARKLQEMEQIPIGLIKTAIGGAHIEAWTSRESLKGYPKYIEATSRFADSQFVRRLTQREDDRENEWENRLDQSDQGLRNGVGRWYEEGCDDSGWGAMPIPSYWADEGLGAKNGSIWFRKEIRLPASLAGKPARLFLGRIVDADFTYVNGRLVGTTSYQYPPRKYLVPAGLLKEGKNTVTVRVVSFRGKGGFIGEKPYRLIFDSQMIDLAGEWKYRVGALAGMLPDRTFLHQIPTGLFNGMLSPISEYAVKGVLWYQGESNTSRPENYEALFVRMIEDWRKKLGQDNLPFLYVQLPNYLEREDKNAVNKWALLREAQRQALKVPNTAMAVTIDVGEWNDLHPLNKRVVGERLARAARGVAYGDRDAVFMGPMYDSMEIRGNRVVLSFTNVGKGLLSKDGAELRNFEAAGEDGLFYAAHAFIERNDVTVWCDQIEKPVAVRYAWSDSPQNINFYNQDGLPASPFRTE